MKGVITINCYKVGQVIDLNEKEYIVKSMENGKLNEIVEFREFIINSALVFEDNGYMTINEVINRRADLYRNSNKNNMEELHFE